MGQLVNTRHELFAQEIARGTAITKAYEIAGYPPNKGNAHRLRMHEGVKARLEELAGQKKAAVEIATLTAAEKAGVDHYWVMRRLRQNAVMSARRGDTAASNRATELIGKHLGMFIEKKQIDVTFTDDSDAYLAQIMELVKAPVIENEPAALPASNDGKKDGSDDVGQTDTIDIIEEIA